MEDLVGPRTSLGTPRDLAEYHSTPPTSRLLVGAAWTPYRIRHTACCLPLPDRALRTRFRGGNGGIMRVLPSPRSGRGAWHVDGPDSGMQKRATYSGPYSLVFAGVTVIVGVVALVRKDSMITIAVAILGLYILHLLSLRALTRDGATTGRGSRSSGAAGADPAKLEVARSGERPKSSARRPLDVVAQASNVVVQASDATELERDDGPVFFSRESGFVREIGEPSIPSRQNPATEDSAWMVQGSRSGDGPEFLPADSEVTMPDFVAQKGASDVKGASEIPIPRKFALGTVAIIRRALDPAQVARVLEEQRKFPKKRFGEIAVELDYITEAQLDDLLEAQKAGLFTEEEIQGARQSLEAFRRNAPPAAV